MLPASYATLLAGGALLLDRTQLAVRTPVAVQRQAPFDGSVPPGQVLPGWATVFVVLCIVNKIRPVESSCCLGAGGCRLGHDGRNASLVAGKHFFPIEVSPIGNHREVLNGHGRAGMRCHRRQLIPIGADIGHLVRHDEVVFCIHRRLYVVAHDTGSPRLHRTGIGVGQGNLFVGCRRETDFHLLQFFHLRLQGRDLVV